MFHNFRKDLVHKQKKLYESVLDHENLQLKNEEPNEFIECSGSNNEDLIASELGIKQEANDQLLMSFEGNEISLEEESREGMASLFCDR